MTSGIYRIDLGNDWFYIGSTVDIKRREREHRWKLDNKIQDNKKMQNVWNKYGVFEFTVLEECVKENLIIREQIYLDKHFGDANNVNLCSTAGSCLGVVRSAETKAKMAKAKRNISAETRAKISASLKGTVLSAKTRAKMVAAKKGKRHSAETKAKISASQKGKTASAETRAKMVAAWDVRKAQAA